MKKSKNILTEQEMAFVNLLMQQAAYQGRQSL